MREAVLSEYHQSLVGGGHQGLKRTYEAIIAKYFWPRMHRDIKNYTKSCVRCQLASNHCGKRPPLNPIPVSPKFERWHVNFLGPLNQSQGGHKYILLFVDSFSRWYEAFPVKSADTATTASVLYSEIICRYCAPAKLVSDRGTHFVNSLIQSLCDIFGVKLGTTSPYNPRSNAVCERLNNFLNKSLRSYVTETQSDWPGLIPGILMAYRLTPAMRLNFHPSFCFLTSKCRHLWTQHFLRHYLMSPVSLNPISGTSLLVPGSSRRWLHKILNGIKRRTKLITTLMLDNLILRSMT